MSHPKKKFMQPNRPCEHIVELLELAVQNNIGIYQIPNSPGNVYCAICNKIYNIDLGAFDGILDWYEVPS